MTELVEFIRARLDERAAQIQLLLAEMPPTVVWQPENRAAGVFECLGLEVNGPKTYRRYWTDGDAIDWGWRMHESAVELYSHAETELALRDVQAKREMLGLAQHLLSWTDKNDGGVTEHEMRMMHVAGAELLRHLAASVAPATQGRPPETVVPQR